MKKLTLLALFFLTVTAAAQQVIRPGQLLSDYQLKMEGGQPRLYVRLRNTSTSQPLTLTIPAGVKFVGRVEPCLPFYTAEPISVKIPPNSQRNLSLGILNLYDFPHHPGPYIMAHPNSDSVKTGALVQRAWKARQSLGQSYQRVAQALVYSAEGMAPSKVRSLFTPAELQAAQRLSQR